MTDGWVVSAHNWQTKGPEFNYSRSYLIYLPFWIKFFVCPGVPSPYYWFPFVFIENWFLFVILKVGRVEMPFRNWWRSTSPTNWWSMSWSLTIYPSNLSTRPFRWWRTANGRLVLNISSFSIAIPSFVLYLVFAQWCRFELQRGLPSIFWEDGCRFLF